MTQAVAYSASEEKMMESEQEPEMDGVDPWKAAMQVCYLRTPTPTWERAYHSLEKNTAKTN